MKYSKKTYIIIISSILAIVSTLYLLPPANPIPAEVRQRKEQIGKEYTRINLELLRIRKLKAETQTNLNAYDEQEDIYEEQQKKLSEESAQIDAQYIGVPEAQADTSQVTGEAMLYLYPKSMWASDVLSRDGQVYITQTQEHHKGMLALDIGTHGKPIDFYTPNLNGIPESFIVTNLSSHETLGRTIQLAGSSDSGQGYRYLIGHVHQSYVTDGQKVLTGDRLGQVGGCGTKEENLKNGEGISTGCHSHVELWKDGVRIRLPEAPNMGVQHEMKPVAEATPIGNLLEKAQVKPDISQKSINVYMSHYNVGDVAQNDATPCIGASGVDLCELRKQGRNFIALTSDQRKILGVKWWDRVRVEGKDFAHDALVMDEMAPRFRYGCIEKQGACIKADWGVLPHEAFLSGPVTITKI